MRVFVASLVIALCGSCGSSMDAETVFHKKPRAKLKLRQTAATLTHTSDTQWTLTKVGSVGASTITWQATATQGTTTSDLLIVNGFFRVVNNGYANATIGNIVVNLQIKNTSGEWVTRVSNVADATDDDLATSANTADGVYTEGPASGPLVFTDATTNSTFALVPQVELPRHVVKKLRFSSTYSNSILQLAPGTKVRAEIIISFGNARETKKSAQNVDINGNGIIDQDEEWVQSIDDTVKLTVPAKVPSNTSVSLLDSVEDITTTGTVTFSNPQINITFPTALVTVDYNGGASGGTITNCAHLVGDGQTSCVHDDDFLNINPINLTTCDTQVIGPHQCTPGTVGCGWEDGDVISYTQASWGNDVAPGGALLVANYDSVYASTFGIVEVGIPGTAGFSMAFTGASTVINYQPSSGPAAALNADLVDPTTSASGVYGGEVLGLRFNIDFSDAGLTTGASGARFGDLTICGLTGAGAGLNGSSIRTFSSIANTALGAGTTPYSIADLNQIAFDLNAAFSNGTVSLFAQDHVFNGACPP